ncbi:MAG: PorT family protein [Saprospiraceae bacterium]|nr:PorT family protein [Saprospiraceae bacterium]
MKVRLLFSSLSLVAIAVTGSAQIRYQMGVTAGVNAASLQSSLFTTASPRIAPLVGCTFAVAWNDYFELNQEITLVFKGAQARAVYFRPEVKPDEHTYSYHYTSFETAVFAGFRPGAGVPLFLQAGAFLGANIHRLDRSQRELMIDDYQSINNAMRAVDLNDAFSGIDFGPAVGIAAGDGRFRANARYYWGARNLYNYLDFVAPGPRIRTNALRLSLSYFFL